MTVIKRYIDGQWTTVVVGRQGDPGLIWQGEWDDSIEYNPPDAVFYNGSAWICAVTNQGETPGTTADWSLFAGGGGGGIGPVEIYEAQGTWDSGDDVSYLLIDTEIPLNKGLIHVVGDEDHENDNVAVRIDYGIGNVGDRIEFYCGSPIMFVNQKLFFSDYIPTSGNNVAFFYNFTENSPSASKLKIISATKVYEELELLPSDYYDVWLLSGDLDAA